MALEWSDLLIPTGDGDAHRLQTIWGWKLEAAYHPVVLSSFGDWFLQADDGAIHRLDVCSGALERIARDGAELEAGLADDDKRREWLRALLVAQLKEEGRSRDAMQCWAFEKHPRLGGKAVAENVITMHMQAWQVLCAAICRTPEGAPFTGFTIDGELVLGPAPGEPGGPKGSE
jgi:hypothetical protein